jgi:hypothetical protein
MIVKCLLAKHKKVRLIKVIHLQLPSKSHSSNIDQKQYIEINMGVGIYDVNNPDFNEEDLKGKPVASGVSSTKP